MIHTVTLNPTIDRTMHFDRLAIGELNRAYDSRTDLSGKGVNVTVALSRFGVESVMLGFVAGIYGQVLEQGLVAMGYTCDFTPAEGETRSNITVIDKATGITTKLNEPGPLVTTKALAALESKLEAQVRPGDWVVFSGSLPRGVDDDTYARLIERVHRAGGQTALDTSEPALGAGCQAQPVLIKPNDIEATHLTGISPTDTTQIVACLQAMLSQGPQRVLLSLGARGAAYADGDTIWMATPPSIVEVSAIGAGDAAMTGALWATLESKPANEILRWAAAAGTATAMEDGTVIPTLDRIKEVYSRTSVRKLA